MDRCCCQRPTASTTWLFTCYYDKRVLIITQGALGTVQSLRQLPVPAAVSWSSSVLFAKHLCWTPPALAKKDEKINIYKEEQLQTSHQNRMSCSIKPSDCRGNTSALLITCLPFKSLGLFCSHFMSLRNIYLQNKAHSAIRNKTRIFQNDLD